MKKILYSSLLLIFTISLSFSNSSSNKNSDIDFLSKDLTNIEKFVYEGEYSCTVTVKGKITVKNPFTGGSVELEYSVSSTKDTCEEADAEATSQFMKKLLP